jgi:hypothetical protein
MFDAQVIQQQYSKKSPVYDAMMQFWKLWGLCDAWRKKAK